MDPEAVLVFWFGPPGGPAGAEKRWWTKDPAFDALIRERFYDLHREIVDGKHEGWRTEPRSCLAYVVVIDQFSRNMFRDDAKAFAFDTVAQAATLGGIHAGLDRELSVVERSFFYMPLLHAEDRQLQEQAILQFATVAEAFADSERSAALNQLVYSVKHRNIILRFGRFPHRNAILGRTSTPAELAFLKEPGSSF